ncbi:MAG: Holliday junction branch migration protein RuvA [Firmicutes bacterium]|nr:Holliday junction branch migration protein RuvA [Bacillota bacterium]
MFAYLRGKLVNKGTNFVVLEVNDIGYRVYVPQRLLAGLELDSEILLHTYMQVREDDISLYGFTELETLTLFETLLTVSGVGPKLAVSIVDTMPSQVFCRAILQNEISVLTKIPGIGKKTAQRLVLELKDKLAAQADSLSTEGEAAPLVDDSAQAQVMAALTALGYRPEEAAGAMRAAAKQQPELTKSESGLLREALRYLGSRSR